MRDILPGNQSQESERFAREKTPHNGDWKREGKEDFPQIRIGHCFSQRRVLKQGMIDLDSTSVNIQRHPPAISKELYGQRVSSSIESSPPDVIVFRNYPDMTDYAADGRFSKSSGTPVDDDYEMEGDEHRVGNEICNGDQMIVKVDPKTPPLIQSPESEPEKAEIWDEPEPPSPSSVIIKVEPRTPSPIVEDEGECDQERDAKRPEFLSGMYTICSTAHVVIALNMLTISL